MAQAQVHSDPSDSERAARSPDSAAPPLRVIETVIEPGGGWPELGLVDLWRFRDLIFHLTLRNVKVRYKQTVLGALWAVLQPVLLMVVFSLTVNRWIPGASGPFPFAVLVFSGLVPWLYFQTAVTSAANSVVSSESLVTKVYFPRLAIPLAAVGAALVDLAIAFVVLLVLMLWYGIPISASIALVPVAVLLLTLASIGAGTLIAALTVSYRDFRHAVGFLLQIWMLATPTVYLDLQTAGGPAAGGPATGQMAGQADGAQATPVDGSREVAESATGKSAAPAAQTGPAAPSYISVGGLLRLNPMTAPIDFFRAATLGLPIPWGRTAASAGVHLLICLAGLLYFRRVEDSFADVI